MKTVTSFFIHLAVVMRLLFLFLFLLSASCVHCLDIHEWQANRAINAIGSINGNALVGVTVNYRDSDFPDELFRTLETSNPSRPSTLVVGRCIVDSDCNKRLGWYSNRTDPVNNPYRTKNPFIQASVRMPTMAIPSTGVGYYRRPTDGGEMFTDPCRGYSINPSNSLARTFDYMNLPPQIVDAASGLFYNECETYMYPGSENFDCRLFHGVTGIVVRPTYSTFNVVKVKYPDMKCIEGQCVRLDHLRPGYNRDYYTDSVSDGVVQSNPLMCPGVMKRSTDLEFVITRSDLFNRGVAYDPYDFSSSGFGFTCSSDQGSVERLRDYSNSLKRTTFTRLPGSLYSEYPPDQIGTCACASNSDCTVDGMICANGQCMCKTDGQCQARYGGSSAKCLTNTVIVNSINPDQETIAGSCSCSVGSEDSCNYNGLCVSTRTLFPNTYIPVYHSTETFTPGQANAAVTSGRCQCYGTTSVWPGVSMSVKNVTVLGSACEHDLLRASRCSGHGKPICVHDFSNTRRVTSKNNFGLIGMYCNEANFHLRGLRQTPDGAISPGICQCDYGYGPEDAFGQPEGVLPCSQSAKCSGSTWAVLVNNKCECTGNTYRNSVGACADNCALVKSNGRGECIFNSRYSELDSNKAYNNDVKCGLGWKTLYNPSAGLGVTEYYDSPYQRTTRPRDSEKPFPWIDLVGSDINQFCNVPYDEKNKLVCGIGGSFRNGACVCSVPFNERVKDTTGRNDGSDHIKSYGTQSPIPFCASICVPFDSLIATDASPKSEINNELCGGFTRGTCVDNQIGGKKCQCLNGYTGLACQTPVCPRFNRVVCSGSGLCDHSSGRCICSFGFQGLACEVKYNECSASQSRRSYPTRLQIGS